MANEQKQLTLEVSKIIKKYSAYFAFTAPAVFEESGRLLASLVAPKHLNYLKEKAAVRADIKLWFPEVKSIIILLLPYWNTKQDDKKTVMKKADWLALRQKRGFKRPPLGASKKGPQDTVIVSRYILGQDYHLSAKEILSKIFEEIKQLDPKAAAKFFTDTSPVLEKALAVKAGLGFQGKNSLLINDRAGSYFFIAGMALNIGLDDFVSYKNIVNDCPEGCDLCLASCPTKAIKPQGGIEQSLCLSCWNTQEKAPLPPVIEELTQTYVEGCDICQQSCPFNKIAEAEILPQLLPLV
ncbi:MAG: DUF1730 domain-containing protein [Elusimicrobiota bacterium]|jgi:epoxyqueuosine reductase QueG|nr:DUF1730 domain-containing protein [Elusimicrobiota bacterium]